MVKRKKLENVTSLGIVFGTFAPLHVGHIDIINQAKRHNDGVLTIVSGYDGDRGDLIGLSLRKRFRYTRETFRYDDLVIVDKLDENHIPAYPNGWVEWLAKLDESIAQYVTFSGQAKIVVYCGETEYKDKINELRPDWEVVLVDRSIIRISGTMIRNNPRAHWHQIAKPFRRFFSTNVLIAGSASNGKTTLARDLSRLFGCPWSPEYAREYQERYNVLDDELDKNDYTYLFTGQFRQTSDLIDSPANNGLIIADTNSTITMAYAEYYLKDSLSEEDFQALTDVYQSMIEKEKWDKIFVVLPQSNYVDDGVRDMTMADEETRDAFTSLTIQLFEEAGLADKIVYLGNPKPGQTFFESLYETAKIEIASLLNQEV